MTTASYEQIVEVLGDVDPLFVKRVEETGASLDEIGEALGDLGDERAGGERRIASSPRVAEVRAILEELFDEPEDGEDGRASSLEGS
jgi:DNA-binding transcriptional MerR regulator